MATLAVKGTKQMDSSPEPSTVSGLVQPILTIVGIVSGALASMLAWFKWMSADRAKFQEQLSRQVTILHDIVGNLRVEITRLDGLLSLEREHAFQAEQTIASLTAQLDDSRKLAKKLERSLDDLRAFCRVHGISIPSQEG